MRRLLCVVGCLSFAAAASADEIVAVTGDNDLVTFDSAKPGVVKGSIAITGLATGEDILAIDARPADGRLYGLGSTSVVYVIDRSTGIATPAGVAFTPLLAGTDFGFDFNPTVDRIRVVSDADVNFRLNPDTGALVATDASLAFDAADANAAANPNVVGVAYDRNDAGATATTLFGIDSGVDALVRIGSVDATPVSPNTGVLTTVGALGVDASGLAGFDIAPGFPGTAYAALQTGAATTSSLYRIDLATGAATAVGTIGGGAAVRDIAVVTDRLQVKKLLIKFNFKSTGKDQLQLDATLFDVPPPAESDVITVDVGGVAQTFTLAKNGHGKAGSDTIFAKVDKKTGKVRIVVHLKKGEFSDDLADEGMDGTADAQHEERTVLLTVTYGGAVFTDTLTLDYKAKAGKTGMAKRVPGDD